jgi:hypothetical protein
MTMCEFITIEKPSLIIWKRFTKSLFNVAVNIEEVYPYQTKILFRQIFNSAEECNRIKAFAGDKMKKYLTGLKRN